MSQTTETPTTGTTETEVNNTQRLIAFKSAYITAASAIDKLKEPLEQLIKIKDFLFTVEKEGLMSEPDWAQFINVDVGPGMSKRLAKERSYNENVSHHGFCLVRFYARIFRVLIKSSLVSYGRRQFDGSSYRRLPRRTKSKAIQRGFYCRHDLPFLARLHHPQVALPNPSRRAEETTDSKPKLAYGT